MIAATFNHGTGDARGAFNYLLSDTNSVGRERPRPPEVVRGNPWKSQVLIESIPHKWKYTSGVLNFAKNIRPRIQEKIIDEFEAHMFPTLDHDQFDITWIRHQDNTSFHLHFVTSRQELHTGKSLNIRPPGSEPYWDAFRNAMNARFNLADPQNIKRQDGINLIGNNIENCDEDPRPTIDEAVMNEISKGTVNNRSDIVNSIREGGLEVQKHSSSISVTLAGETYQLRGKPYRAGWEQHINNNQASLDQEKTQEMMLEARASRAERYKNRFNSTPDAASYSKPKENPHEFKKQFQTVLPRVPGWIKSLRDAASELRSKIENGIQALETRLSGAQGNNPEQSGSNGESSPTNRKVGQSTIAPDQDIDKTNERKHSDYSQGASPNQKSSEQEDNEHCNNDGNVSKDSDDADFKP